MPQLGCGSSFLGVDDWPNDRDRSGIALADEEDQLRAEIQMIGRLIKEAFVN
jgi:hypothetical protein